MPSRRLSYSKITYFLMLPIKIQTVCLLFKPNVFNPITRASVMEGLGVISVKNQRIATDLRMFSSTEASLLLQRAICMS